MLTFIFMIAFSLYFVAYGFIALFKQDWLLKIRDFSARLEGKSSLKREELHEVGTAAKVMAVVALIVGLVGVVLSIMMLMIAIQAQSGVIDL